MGEFGILEETAHQPFGQQVLDEHLIDVGGREFRVERRAANGDEFSEGGLEGSVCFVGFVDVFAEGLGEVGNAAFELVHGAFKFALVGVVVGEEAVEEVGEVGGVAKGEFAGFGAVLIENGGAGVFEYSVAGGVAGFEFAADFGGEVVGGVFRLPPAAGEAEFVADGAVGNDAFASGVGGEFGDEIPAAAFGGFVEERVEGGFEAELVGYLLGFEGFEVAEIGAEDRI